MQYTDILSVGQNAWASASPDTVLVMSEAVLVKCV